jgi:hypothetical protein
MGVVPVWGQNDQSAMRLVAIGGFRGPDRGTPKSTWLGSMNVWETSPWGKPPSRGAGKGEVGS